MFRRISLVVTLLIIGIGLALAPRHLVSRPSSATDFVHFESSHVHPATLTPAADRLLVVNTPDNRLSIIDVTSPTELLKIADLPVGLEPVSVAALSDSEAWVVNHLSDDVSVVNLNTRHVRATIRVGDEPSDVVFAGSPLRAYVSVSEEDAVKVYDPTTLSLITTIPIAGRMPRALATDAARTKVYVGVFHGGNRTSVLSATEVADSIPDDPDFPRDPSNKLGHPRPDVAGIIQQQIGEWRDEYGKLWNSKVPYSMAEVDVAEIDAATNVVSRNFGDMGSVVYNLAVSPANGKIAVTNTLGRNILRYEPKLSGYLVETHLSFVTQAGAVVNRVLNPHINYNVTPGPQSETDSALGIPAAVTYSSNGSRAYVAAFANNKVGVIDPNAAGPISQLKGRVPCVAGPSGIVVDDPRGRIYVVGRFRNEVQALSTADFSEIDRTPIGFDPTPDAIVNGRKFFYGGFTSGHGDQACATCHVFGDMDNLAWDLGDPFAPYLPGTPPLDGFDPQKGPLTTQSMRGMTNTEPLHWRGDRVNLAAFNGAFVSLMGRAVQLPDSEMTAFIDFALPMVHPPNPRRRLDRSLPDSVPGGPSALAGQEFFFNTPIDTGSGMGSVTCNSCHTATSFGPGTNRQMIPNEALFIEQDLKVPHLRNLYRKTGFEDRPSAVNKRGFGFTHDGAVDDLFAFLQSPQFSFDPDTAIGNRHRRNLKAFLLAFDTGLAPAAGYQVTFTGVPDPVGVLSVDTLKAQADLNYCDLVAKGRINGVPRSWLYIGTDSWDSDLAIEDPITTTQLLATAGLGSELTVTGVPDGSGQRMGLDRDRDTYFDGDEVEAGSDPGNPLAIPSNVSVPTQPERFGVNLVRPNPFGERAEVSFHLTAAGRVDLVVLDVLGREVRSIARGQWLPVGSHRMVWDGRRSDGGQVGAGMYFVQLRTDKQKSVRPVVRIR